MRLRNATRTDPRRFDRSDPGRGHGRVLAHLPVGEWSVRISAALTPYGVTQGYMACSETFFRMGSTMTPVLHWKNMR